LVMREKVSAMAALFVWSAALTAPASSLAKGTETGGAGKPAYTCKPIRCALKRVLMSMAGSSNRSARRLSLRCTRMVLYDIPLLLETDGRGVIRKGTGLIDPDQTERGALDVRQHESPAGGLPGSDS